MHLVTYTFLIKGRSSNAKILTAFWGGNRLCFNHLTCVCRDGLSLFIWPLVGRVTVKCVFLALFGEMAVIFLVLYASHLFLFHSIPLVSVFQLLLHIPVVQYSTMYVHNHVF